MAKFNGIFFCSKISYRVSLPRNMSVVCFVFKTTYVHFIPYNNNEYEDLTRTKSFLISKLWCAFSSFC